MSSRFDRGALSLGVVLACTGAALHYALRDRPRTGLADTSVVVFLEQYGPVWPVLFGAAAGVVLVALLSGRAVVPAHLAAAAVLVGYATALWFTAAAFGSGWVTASMSTGLAVHALVLAGSYGQVRGRAWMRR